MTTYTPTVEHRLHQIFEVSLLAKGLLATAEMLGGLGLWLLSNDWIVRTAQMLGRREITGAPTDHLTLRALHFAEGFSVQSQSFWAWYMIVHATMRLAVVLGLVLRIDWAYPASIVMLFGFIAYQLERFWFTGAWSLIALTLFDLAVIWLIWHEHQQLRLRRAAAK
ncbi:hypothetical protein GALL_464940 [mine drainage metagenome]|uniref:DUF2127 domain-containing protein n=1 Tax=mine drainage metagenome TaxID=410659 RepID=A0A1J5PVR7_9ZZZZ